MFATTKIISIVYESPFLPLIKVNIDGLMNHASYGACDGLFCDYNVASLGGFSSNMGY